MLGGRSRRRSKNGADGFVYVFVLLDNCISVLASKTDHYWWSGFEFVFVFV